MRDESFQRAVKVLGFGWGGGEGERESEERMTARCFPLNEIRNVCH